MRLPDTASILAPRSRSARFSSTNSTCRSWQKPLKERLPRLNRYSWSSLSRAMDCRRHIGTSWLFQVEIHLYRQAAGNTHRSAHRGVSHTPIHQAVAATGRLSSSDPNLQNIPIRSEAGRRIRQAFVPEQGWKMRAADYSQIEFPAHHGPSVRRQRGPLFAAGEDIHKATAESFGVALDEVTLEQRRSAKAYPISGTSAFGSLETAGDRVRCCPGAGSLTSILNASRGQGVHGERTRAEAHDRGYAANPVWVAPHLLDSQCA